MAANPFLDYMPEVAYYSDPTAMSFIGTDPARRRAYNTQYTNIYNQYLGKLGQQMRQGEAPSLSWSQWVENTSPFTARYAALSPTQRGMGTRQYSPSTRHIYF